MCADDRAPLAILCEPGDMQPVGEASTLSGIYAGVQGLAAELHGMYEILSSQQAQISKLAEALASVRVSRTQELAINEAIRARARELAETNNLPGQQRKIAAAIRATVRAITGARASGDVPASAYGAVIAAIGSWAMPGALRRIRKEMEASER